MNGKAYVNSNGKINEIVFGKDGNNVLIRFSEEELNTLSVMCQIVLKQESDVSKAFRAVCNDIKHIRDDFVKAKLSRVNQDLSGKKEDKFVKSRFDLKVTSSKRRSLTEEEMRERIEKETSSRIGQAGCTGGDCD